ncbi:hypothetical protein J6S35_03340 [Candidatus Saccharibacteria bacterium]|nr:hypothetical protein [Candidatus Saccharibacteria bacterium]
MLNKNNLLEALQKNYPDLHFISGKRFSFRPPKTIVVSPDESERAPMLLFHELGHALSNKYTYQTATERLKIEVAAWKEGKKAYLEFTKKISLPSWDDEYVEDSLDTYRDWLHSQSKCKKCGLTMYQSSDKTWFCPFCDQFKT